MPRLIAPTGHTLDLPAQHLTFGESPECDIPLTAGYGLAALHFEIAPATDGTSFLRDASGGTGTLVNGQPVNVAALQEGDVIQAGQLVLRFSAGGDPAPPLPPKALVVAAAAVPVSVVRLPAEGVIVTAADAASRDTEPTTAAPPLPHQNQRPLLKPTSRTSLTPSPLVVRVACTVLLLIAAVAFLATDPGQRLVSPLIAKIQQWNTQRAPKPKTPPPAQQATSGREGKLIGATPKIIPQTSHKDIIKRLLTERTQTLIYADLSQLVPSYNLMASQQGLPSHREMSESFRKTYGAVIDPFEQLSVLQSDSKEDFLLVLTGKEVLDLEKIIGQPARPPSGGTSTPRTYTVKGGNRTLNVALYDPFTLLLGSPRAVLRAIKSDRGLALREALCMYPDTALINPGALIIVKRVNVPPAPGHGAPAMAFETIVTNLFLSTSNPSTLTLTKNPEVPAEAFVDAAAPAFKEQATSLGSDAKIFADLSPSDISLTLNEASITLPGGPTLISSALETMARSFARSAPSMTTILQAQDAVMRFNTARSTGAETALRAGSPREALQMLNQGIRGGGALAGATFQLSTREEEMDNLASLLEIDQPIGLVYRPDADALCSSSLVLAIKARNYRNAELLIHLWQAAKLKAVPNETPATAYGRILTWSSTPEGRQQRSILGLPTLTPGELEGALAPLAISKQQLAWKPGEAGYRGWIRLVHPDPRRDATRLAKKFNEAVLGGAIPASATRDLKVGLGLITHGVEGRGKYAGITYKVADLTPEEISAASSLLSLEEGQMTVRVTPAPSLTIGSG